MERIISHQINIGLEARFVMNQVKVSVRLPICFYFKDFNGGGSKIPPTETETRVAEPSPKGAIKSNQHHWCSEAHHKSRPQPTP